GGEIAGVVHLDEEALVFILLAVATQGDLLHADIPDPPAALDPDVVRREVDRRLPEEMDAEVALIFQDLDVVDARERRPPVLADLPPQEDAARLSLAACRRRSHEIPVRSKICVRVSPVRRRVYCTATNNEESSLVTCTWRTSMMSPSQR